MRVESGAIRQPTTKKELLYSVLDPSVDAEHILGYSVPVVDIPRVHLFGIQTRDEYERSKIASVKASYAAHPDHLQSNPVLACALPAFRSTDDAAFYEIRSGARYYIAITDGHHRVRYAPRSVREIPARLLTVAEAVQVNRNLRGKVYAASGETDMQRAYNQLLSWVGDTTKSFVEETGRPDLERRVSTIQVGASRADMIIT